MQKNSRHFWDVRPAKVDGFSGEEKQSSQPARPRKLLDHVRDVLRCKTKAAVECDRRFLEWFGNCG